VQYSTLRVTLSKKNRTKEISMSFLSKITGKATSGDSANSAIGLESGLVRSFGVRLRGSASICIHDPIDLMG
jgi:hypothetical protein